MILLDFMLQIFVFIFRIYFCANIFGAIVFNLRFKIDAVVIVK
jgi:hypothetical protein